MKNNTEMADLSFCRIYKIESFAEIGYYIKIIVKPVTQM
jgi:hypothetical protein